MSANEDTTAPALSPLKRAFIALEEARARVAALEGAAREPIAIIGLGCRIPGGADDPESYWRLLSEGIDAVGPVPADRWDAEALYDANPDTPGRIAAKAGGFLRSVDQFDPAFFGIAPREAQGMDPQQRLLLEVSWEALEHAGQPADRLERSATGVYVGMAASDYAYMQLAADDPTLLDAHFTSGIAHSVASGRLSYLLGLQGPSLTIDTACSSSLVAVHLACQALRAGDCRMALAAGVNLLLSPDLAIALSHSRMLAPDGRCKTFDASADGFGRAEGCGVLVLKRLSDAQADGDRVLAVVRGTAVNQDGPSSGLTAPNGPAQEAVIREALARAGVAPREVGYIEAHGTGTQLGDPLEVAALGNVFGGDRDAAHPLWLGSVKTNVGHLEAAAGVAGLIKLVLALRHKIIPPHLHFRTPSPHIAWSELPFRIPTAPTPWTPIGDRRIAGVSSFGFSGTNAHIVIEEAPRIASPIVEARPESTLRLFPLSARSPKALAALAARHAAALAGRTDADLADACYTAAVGRATFAHRAVIAARTMDELRERLTALAEGSAADGVRTAHVTRRDPARVAFLFTGQGSQYPGMTRGLYEHAPVFRAALDRCATLLAPHLDRPLLDVLFPPGVSSSLDETAYTQPALFAAEFALAELWRSWGVTPVAVMGHSVGEYVAACLAGVITLEDALRLIATRGRLMQSLPVGGAMAAIFADEATVADAIAPQRDVLSIAALNGPQQTVISGKAAAVESICAQFTARGVRCQPLSVSHAFHSPLVDPILDAFESAAASVRFAPPEIPLVSNVTGGVATAREVADPGYWRRHVRGAVRFADGLRTLATLSPDVCVEVGPNPALLAFASSTLGDDTPVLVPTLRKGRNDVEQALDALASAYLAGADVNWRGVYAGETRRITDLPSYPFERERWWFEARPGGRTPTKVTAKDRVTGHPLLGHRVRSPLEDVAQFEVTLRTDSLPFLDDHRVHGRAILPATGHVEMALAAGHALFGDGRAVEDLVIAEPLVVADDAPRRVQFIARLNDHNGASFEIHSTADADVDDPWIRHSEGRLVVAATAPSNGETIDAITARCGEAIAAEAHYAELARRELVFGPSLRGVVGIRRRDGEAIGEITSMHSLDGEASQYHLHPAFLDACLQVISAALPATRGNDRAYLPLAVDRITRHRAPNGRAWSHAVVHSRDGDMLRSDVRVLDAHGVVAELRGLSLRAARDETHSDLLYEMAWLPAPDESAAFLPTPPQLAERLSPVFPKLAESHGLIAYHAAFVELESLAAAYVVRALRTLGWTFEVGERVTADELARSLGVVARYWRLLARLLDILAEDGILRKEAGAYEVVAAPPESDVVAQSEALLARHPSSHARLTLAARCGEELAGVLRGTVDPLQLLFPGGSAKLAESLYQDAPESQVFNQLVRDAVRAAVDSLPAGRTLRVLEVGGGTGGTTAWVAPMLPADCVEYLFTDVSPLLVQRARERFADFPFMQFQVLDLEKDLASQHIDGQFDLVIAINVIHATADLSATLRRVNHVLVQGGTLLMLEVAGLERWIDITFGLTEGWWRFTDTSLRRDYPLLDREQWQSLLATLGFDAAMLTDETPLSREALIAARKTHSAPVVRDAGTWLLFADAGGVGTGVANRLRADGQRVVLVHPGRAFSIAGDAAQLDPTQTANYRDLLAADLGTLRGVVHLWSLDVDTPRDVHASLDASQRHALGSLLSIVQALGARSFLAGSAPGLWVATRGAQPVGEPRSLQVAQAPVWGLGRVIALEHPELRPVRVDLDPDADVATQSDVLHAELWTTSSEDQIAHRDGTRYVARLARSAAGDARVETESVALTKGRDGTFDGLTLQSVARRHPGPGEVEIRVYAAGLNFRDVMNAVAMRDDPEPLGGECAGRVVAVGDGVTHVAVGDEVVAIGTGCFATYTTTNANVVARKPAHLSFEAATTVPFAFMTARYALHTLGRLTGDDTVLIHAGAGGVGMAAIQLAQRAGATIIATAGSDQKRAFLRSLGVPHVLDSRTLDFGEEIATITRGRGVDVVLNSLAGEFIKASLNALAPNGRFLEIGKRDIWTPDDVRVVKPEAQYFAIDLAALRVEDPVGIAALFAEVIADVDRGTLRPLPVRTFPLERASNAFRFMAQARHVGKVVLTVRAAERSAVRGDATYLITGGLTGLGLLTAQRLAARGARHLVLMGRRPPGEAATAAIAAMETSGVQVRIVQSDVSDADQIARALAMVGDELPPLRGIVHSAGALQDGALLQQDWPRFAVPFGAKVDGAWSLHLQTRNIPLDFFVMYSSAASVLGSSGQGNHAAANAFMDALAHHRRAHGLPALSINWGAWSDVGAAAERGVDQRVAARGMGVIAPEQGAAILERLMRGDSPQVGVFPVQWTQFLQEYTDGPAPRFLHDVRAVETRTRAKSRKDRPVTRAASTETPRRALRDDIAQASPPQRNELMLTFVTEQVARVLGLRDARSIDLRQPLNELGLDSLMAVELRNRLGTGLALERSLPATLVFDYPTVDALVTHLMFDVLALSDPAESRTAAAVPVATIDAIADLSDEEIDRLFAAKVRKS